MRWLMVVVLLVFVISPAAVAEDDAVKKLLTGVGKGFSAGSASSISRHFPEEGKVDLRLSRIKNGAYRKAQAASLLSTWFKGIKPGSCSLKTVKGLVGRFTFTYKVVADGTTVTKKIQVSLRKVGQKLSIVGILES
jgi:hypothetical protein